MNVRSNPALAFIILLCSLNSCGRYLTKDDTAVSSDPGAHKTRKARRIRMRTSNVVNDWAEDKQTKLQKLLQQIYLAEDTVKKESLEVKRLLGVVAAADKGLEEATNQVRILSTNLQEAQRVAAQRALKSHTAHLQLSAHDQLMFTSRQRVDALSAQAIAAQTDFGLWPGAGMFYNASPPDEDGREPMMFEQPNPQNEAVEFGKTPIIYRNAVPQPQYYPVMTNGVQFVPVDQ